MDKRVVQKLMTSPFTVHIQGKPDSMGDCADTANEEYLGYVLENVQEFINADGKTELSNMQIYVDGPDAVKIPPTALISCLSHKNQRIVKRAVYYRAQSIPAIGVFYLP